MSSGITESFSGGELVGQRVLIVEDNEMNLDLATRRLTRMGFEVSVARDGAEGLERARSDRFDIILMDMSLPIMDGWEATRRLKEDPATQGIPVIALTAHAMAGDRERALQAGCDEYETKPVNFRELAAKMAEMLRPIESQVNVA